MTIKAMNVRAWRNCDVLGLGISNALERTASKDI